MKPANTVLSRYGATIFETMSMLARQHNAINLGQGFPEGCEPREIVEQAAKATLEESNQYPSMMGIPELRQAVAAHDRDFYGLALDWQTETLIVSGGTEALAVSLLALIDPGDEVVVIEPIYDTYLPMMEGGGGVPILVGVKPPEWKLPLDELAAAFGPKTKLVLFNSPMNPTAKVFSGAELDAIAALVAKWDTYAICDEVYEHLVFDGGAHVPLITLPGMRERTIRIGSAGKTFSLTGWKVGYVVAAPALIQRAVKAHQFMIFTTPPNLQHAVAYGLRKEGAFFTDFTASMQAKRDRLRGGLEAAGFTVAPCHGTYFINVDIGSVGFQGDDADFCREIIETAGVAAIPMSAFYVTEPDTSTVRFCFAKPDPMLDEAIARLQRRFG